MARRVFSRAAGAAWLLWAAAVPGILLSFTPDGHVESFGKTVILAASFFCAGFGLLHFLNYFSSNRFFQNLSVFLTALLIAAPLTIEGFFRASIFLNVPGFRSPEWYADYAADETYWELERVWRHRFNFPKGRLVQPLLGWSQTEVTDVNPLGLQPDSLARIKNDGRKKILFYGDSYVKGHADPEYQLPRYLQEKITDAAVIDLGVGGYGTDQIYLMFRETHKLVEKPFVLAGVLINDDMNRSALKFRIYWKPYFTLDASGKRELRGVPVRQYGEIRLRVFSYAAAFVRIRLKIVDKKKIFLKQLNRTFIESFSEECREHCGGLAYVLFYPINDLRGTCWQEKFLKAELEKRGIDIIDTKPMLYRYAAEHNMDSMKPFYDPVDYHHNNLGNGVIAEGILSYLKTKGYAAGQKSGVSL